MILNKANDNQKEAIRATNKNILLSAGAGSGKTFVLTNRILYQMIGEDDTLKMSIKDFLVLTFTDLAAGQMKDKIRQKLFENSKIDGMDNEIDKLESASIMTFDAFCNYLVRKYYFKLNLDPSFTILDDSVMSVNLNLMLDEILMEEYSNKNPIIDKYFSEKYFIDKNDNQLKVSILDLYYKLEKYINPKEIIEDIRKILNNPNYLNDRYKQSFILFSSYLVKIVDPLNCLVENLKYIYENNPSAQSNGRTKESLKNKIDGYSAIKDKVSELLKKNEINSDDIITLNFLAEECVKSSPMFNLKNQSYCLEQYNLCNRYHSFIKKFFYTSFNDEQIFKGFVGSRELENKNEFISRNQNHYDIYSFILDIIERLYTKIDQFKINRNSYQFIDISRFAISLLAKNDQIRKEISESYKQILIDEYQDDNDIQEYLIHLISNDNVFCVGDIKQSIYRFRNSNPKIFNEKLNSYDTDINSSNRLITMDENYRSNLAVINSVNDFFSVLMTKEYGEVDFGEKHKLNKANDNFTLSEGRGLELFKYSTEQNEHDYDLEPYIIANDILNKINQKYTVLDKDTGKYRECNFGDFAILFRNKTHIEEYAKTLENLGIKVALNVDKEINSDNIINLFCDLLKLIYLSNKKLDESTSVLFFRSYIAVARSYLFKYDDEYIFNIVMSQKYKEGSRYKFNKEIDPQLINDEIIQKSYKLSSLINNMSFRDFCYKAFDEFEFFSKLHKLSNIQDKMVVIKKSIEIISNNNDSGFDLFEMATLLEDMSLENNDKSRGFRYKLENMSESAVKILTVHSSKGLEFPIIYHANLFSEHKTDSDPNIMLDSNLYLSTKKDYGIFCFHNRIVNDQLEISETIRLLYVALTRAQEQNIILFNESNNYEIMQNVGNFGEMINIVYDKNKEAKKDLFLERSFSIDDINKFKEYKNSDSISYKNKINYRSSNIDTNGNKVDFGKQINVKTISHRVDSLLEEVDLENLENGLRMHNILQHFNFITKDLSKYDDEDKRLINNVLNTEPFKEIDKAELYPELEFVYTNNNERYNGQIDLLAIYNDHIDIIDYKNSNIDHDYYDYQLNRYRSYIESIYKDKKINCYLVSISKGKYRIVNN